MPFLGLIGNAYTEVLCRTKHGLCRPPGPADVTKAEFMIWRGVDSFQDGQQHLALGAYVNAQTLY